MIVGCPGSMGASSCAECGEMVTGISNSTFLSYIDARAVLPNVETAVKIAKALDVSVEYLVTGEDSVHGSRYKAVQDISADLLCLDQGTLDIIKRMIHALVPLRG